jgi:hypothetical protein
VSEETLVAAAKGGQTATFGAVCQPQACRSISDSEIVGRCLVLDLKNVTLIGQGAVKFPACREVNSINIKIKLETRYGSCGISGPLQGRTSGKRAKPLSFGHPFRTLIRLLHWAKAFTRQQIH